MAAFHDSGYRQPESQPYASSYGSNPSYDPRAYPPGSFPHYQEPPTPRSRASSNSPSDSLPQPVRQPLNNALNNAFDKSDAARAVDADIIAQITAEVKKSVLDEIKLNGVGVTTQAHPAPPPQSCVPQSPTSTQSSFPTRNVYTPPSPRHPDYSSQGPASPDPLAQDPMFDDSGDTPTPRVEKNAPGDVPQEGRSRSRPAPASRMSQDDNFTPIEKMWQRLFDPQGQPTPRLGQFLRGLAIHLIEDYEPKKSLVITPSKMLKFYNEVKLPEEIYPWQTIFGRLPYATLGKVYREMRCQHHLVQEHLTEQAQIPALTPEGFQEWMTIMIQAYPDTEYERLSKAVLDMPISNADDYKERFPKELPRRLFPQRENLQAQQRCAAALSAGGVGPLRKAPTFPPPPPMGQSNGPAPGQERERSRGFERERSPYSSQKERVIDSEDEEGEPLAVPIERERKPYTAAPGGGKVHDEDLSQSLQSESSLHGRRRRTQSSSGQGQWIPPPPPSQSHQRTSSKTSRRPRSPSFSNYGTRSDPNVRDVPSGYYSSNMYDSEEEQRRYAKEVEMKRNDWARRQAEDDNAGGPVRRATTGMSDGSYDSQPRSIYDDDHYRGRGYTVSSNGYDGRGYDSRHDSRRY